VKSLRTLATAVVVLGLAVGCGSGEPAAGGKAGGPDRVTYVTGFGSFGREAYAWYGLDKGYFTAEGIDLKIIPGAGNQNLKYLDSGRAQFTAIDYASAVLDYGNHTDTAFRVISAVNQRTTVAIMTLSGSNITRPADLVGKTLGVATGAVPQTLFPAYAKLAGIPDKVTWVPASPQALPQLLASKKVDGIGQFVVGRPAVAAAVQAAGLSDTVVTLPYGDEMADLYGNVLVAPTKLISSNPDLVHRFNRAYVKSLGAALRDPGATAQILHKYVPAQQPGPAEAEVRLLAPYCGTGAQLGTLAESRVGKGIALIQNLGLIKTPVNAAALVDFDAVAAAR
jgi:NitT/TauT family transport system substrate-binding protein